MMIALFVRCISRNCPLPVYHCIWLRHVRVHLRRCFLHTPGQGLHESSLGHLPTDELEHPHDDDPRTNMRATQAVGLKHCVAQTTKCRQAAQCTRASKARQ